ncbi:MAG: hypothetical protein ACYC7E_21315 [Armatimonadota bacterium]
MTEKQRTANRRNAQLSTGPRTEAGKVHSSCNALKHGFFAREVVLPQEDAEEFDTFSQAMREDLRPCGAMEEVLAGQVIVSAWRLKRFARIESGVFAELLSNVQRELAGEPNVTPLPDLPEEVLWGRAFIAGHDNGAMLARLTRYQSLLTREFYRAFHDLQRLQATRPPVTDDDWLPEQNEAMRRQSGAGERVMSPVYAADRVLPWATGDNGD